MDVNLQMKTNICNRVIVAQEHAIENINHTSQDLCYSMVFTEEPLPSFGTITSSSRMEMHFVT